MDEARLFELEARVASLQDQVGELMVLVLEARAARPGKRRPSKRRSRRGR